MAVATDTDTTGPIATYPGTTYTIFIHLRTTRDWLELSRGRRAAVIAEHVAPLLGRYASTTSLRWFDAEAFSADPTDIAVVTTTALQDWYDLYEELRDSPLWTVPYFTTERIVLALEQGFEGFEQRRGKGDVAAPST